MILSLNLPRYTSECCCTELSRGRGCGRLSSRPRLLEVLTADKERYVDSSLALLASQVLHYRLDESFLLHALGFSRASYLCGSQSVVPKQ